MSKKLKDMQKGSIIQFILKSTHNFPDIRLTGTIQSIEETDTPGINKYWVVSNDDQGVSRGRQLLFDGDEEKLQIECF